MRSAKRPHRPEAEFFADPIDTAQRRYEALRAYFLEGATAAQAAARFGYAKASVQAMVRDFRRGDRDFFARRRPGPRVAPAKQAARDQALRLRAAGHSITEITQALATTPQPLRLPSDFAGLLLLVPGLVALDLPGAVSAAHFPGTREVPAISSVLSLLALKATGRRRVSHVDDVATDPALATFAGLESLPKATALGTYSYRLTRRHDQRLLAALGPAMVRTGQATGTDFDLDFHAIMHYGHDVALETHYVPRRSQRTESVLTFFAHDGQTRNLVYANADLTKADQAGEALTFARHWQQATGKLPELLVFDSKVTTGAGLFELHQAGIRFLAVRGLGHEAPTLILTNNHTAKPAKLIDRYAKRMIIEQRLAEQIRSFHLDALSSAVALNVDLDTPSPSGPRPPTTPCAAAYPAIPLPPPTPSGAASSPPAASSPSAPPRSWSASPSAPPARCCARPTCQRSRSPGGVGAGCASRSPSARSRAQFTVRESELGASVTWTGRNGETEQTGSGKRPSSNEEDRGASLWAVDQMGGPGLLDRGGCGCGAACRQAQRRPEERRVGVAAEKRRVHQGDRASQAVHLKRHPPSGGGLRALGSHHPRRPGRGRRRRQALRRPGPRQRQGHRPDSRQRRPGAPGGRAHQDGQQRLERHRPCGQGPALHRPRRRRERLCHRAGRLCRRLHQRVHRLRLHAAVHHGADRHRHPAVHLPQPGAVAVARGVRVRRAGDHSQRFDGDPEPAVPAGRRA